MKVLLPRETVVVAGDDMVFGELEKRVNRRAGREAQRSGD
jgi:hypothetical protein